MPAKNSRKSYRDDGYYHIYNRGVEKRLIFVDEQDCAVFLSYLKIYLLPKDEETLRLRLSDSNINYRDKEKILSLLRLNNFYGEVTLLAYSLMPNHFHLFIKQKSLGSIDKFMNSLCTRYTMYFNKKYKRVGPLYQGVYKAVMVETDQQFLYLSGYIHRNLFVLASKGHAFRSYTYNLDSYPEYLGQRKTEWVHPEEILAYFSKINPQLAYQGFVEQTNDFSPILSKMIDDDI